LSSCTSCHGMRAQSWCLIHFCAAVFPVLVLNWSFRFVAFLVMENTIWIKFHYVHILDIGHFVFPCFNAGSNISTCRVEERI
jgi:hypothetical protein